MAHFPFVGKRSRRRQPSPATGRPTAQAELTGLMLDALPTAVGEIAGPPIPGGGDIEPLLVALLTGVLDDHLERIATIVNARVDALCAAEELIAGSRLRVGQRVRIGHNVRPLYLHGRAATITAHHNDSWEVQLDEPEPVGRYTTGELRVRSTQIQPET